MLWQLQENVVFLTQKDVVHDNVLGELCDLLGVSLPNVKLSFLT